MLNNKKTNFFVKILWSIFFLNIYMIRITRCDKDIIELKNNYIEGIVKGDAELLSNCTIYLDSDTYVSPKSDGKFLFKNVKEGEYTMYVNHPYLEFNKYYVEVKKQITPNNGTLYLVQAYELNLPFEKSNLIVNNIVFKAKRIYDFLIPKKKFNITYLFKSPLFLIFLFFLILLSVLPKMQKISEAENEENGTEQISYKSDFLESIK
ncbi:conserved protein, unknown function [Plasmodium sp. DRC-Itaito]|nr:conserved protein, unknown function [Plasmodium sp. DRC-Itaito]